MPELPEVETVRRGLEKLVRGKTIQCVQVNYAPMIKTGAETFILDVVDQEILSIGRRGKYLLFELSDMVLVSHLRMEGKYFFFEEEGEPTKHTHVIFTFTDGSSLFYQDVRKFGTMELLKKREVTSYFQAHKIGPEPTVEAFQLAPFIQQLSSSKKVIKPYLLDQSLVAGLGNIYADEVLWRAKIHPARVANTLTLQEMALLHDEIIHVLQLGIQKGGSTIRTYRNALGKDGTMQDFLEVYGKAGQACMRCGYEIEKIKLAGRGTHFCPHCQRKSWEK